MGDNDVGEDPGGGKGWFRVSWLLSGLIVRILGLLWFYNNKWTLKLQQFKWWNEVAAQQGNGHGTASRKIPKGSIKDWNHTVYQKVLRDLDVNVYDIPVKAKTLWSLVNVDSSLGSNILKNLKQIVHAHTQGGFIG